MHDDISGLADHVRTARGANGTPEATERTLATAVPGDGMPAKTVRRLVREQLDPPADAIVQLRRKIRTAAGSTGIIKKSQVEKMRAELARRTKVPPIGEITPVLAGKLDLHSYGPCWGIKKTLTDRIRAISDGKDGPSTTDEIARASGVPRRHIATAIARCRDVIRVSPRKWDLKERTDHEFQNVSEEIERCITKAGGTAKRTEVVKTLSRRLGVPPDSVKTIMTGPLFTKSGEYVTLADSTSALHIALDQTLAVTDDEGRPCWETTARPGVPSIGTITGVPSENTIKWAKGPLYARIRADANLC